MQSKDIQPIKRLIALYKKFMGESVILNWSALNKSILVLILAGLDQILWLAWNLYSHFSPFNQWMNPNYFKFHVGLLSITTILSFILAFVAYRYRHILFFKQYFPFLSIAFFSIVFMYAGYSIGITSPTTIAGYISIVSLGLVLFERKIVYGVFLPITVFLLCAIVLSAHGKIVYAPVFSSALNTSVLSENTFWVYSMLFLYIPIFFVTLVLFEMLLIQWSNREKAFNQMSTIDPLTGIFNRRSIGLSLKLKQQEQCGYAIILMDLDDFKSINDTYGHEAGDMVLQQVAEILKDSVRGNDIVGRFGGEEFIFILNTKKHVDVLAIAERCRQQIYQHEFILTGEKSIQISASFGVSLSAVDLAQEEVIRRADQALYFAKKQGRNQVRSYAELHS